MHTFTAINAHLKELAQGAGTQDGDETLATAEKLIAELSTLIGIPASTVGVSQLFQNIRVQSEISRFVSAPGFRRQAAAYTIAHTTQAPLDLKLFWFKRTSKTNLAWAMGLTPNYEDSPENFTNHNISIDFILPEAGDRLFIILSLNYKLRVLELHQSLTHTQREILEAWTKAATVLADKCALHALLWKSFDFEPINKQFYKDLLTYFDQLTEHLERAGIEKEAAKLFSVRLIGRLLFLWFVEKKGFLNPDKHYFHVSASEDQSVYYRAKLEPLFFEVLNTEVRKRKNDDTQTPFLNGGLFEAIDIDFRGDRKISFPNQFFSGLYERLNHYNFTVDEGTSEYEQVAIDPEMLGRVFENLLASMSDETGAQARKAKGAFYTPREIVDYMCKESLIAYLSEKVADKTHATRDRIRELVTMSESAFRDQDHNKRRDFERDLGKEETKKVLADLRVLDPAVGSGAFPMGMLHLLVKVYGRLDPALEKKSSELKRDILSQSLYGVDIDQMAIQITRLRAWLSILVDMEDLKKVEPLPNLEFKFVCANTLIPLAANGGLYDTISKDDLMQIRDDYYRATGKAEKEKLRKQYLAKIASQGKLFATEKALQLAEYNPFNPLSSCSFYDPDLMHGVAKFDVVIGNPPYISAVTMARNNFQKEYFKKTYPFATGSYDMYILFLLKGIDLLNKIGVYAWIIPNKFLIADYAKKCKEFLIMKNGLINSIDVSNFKVFEETGVYPIVIVGRRGYDKEYRELSIDKYEDLGISLFRKTKKLKEYKTFKEFGLKLYSGTTGFQAGQIIPFIKIKQTKNSIPFSVSGCVDRYYWSNKDVRYMHNFYDAAFIERNNSVADSKWDFWNNPKIIIAGMTKVIESVYSSEPVALGVGIYGIYDFAGLEPKCLTGLLNSKYMTFYFQQKFRDRHLAGGYLGITKSTIEELPLVDIDKTEQTKISDAVDKIQTAKKSDQKANTEDLEKQIDVLVYKLYGLNAEEIKIIEDSVK